MDRKCPILKTIEFLGKRWALPVIVELYKGRNKWKRYSRLKGKLMNITPKILSVRLRELEKEKLIKRRVDTKGFPIKSEYSLTGRGRDLVNIIKAFREWGLKWKVKNEYCKNVGCKHCRL